MGVYPGSVGYGSDYPLPYPVWSLTMSLFEFVVFLAVYFLFVGLPMILMILVAWYFVKHKQEE